MAQIIIVSFSLKRRINKDEEGKHGIIYRPDYMVISVFDTLTRCFLPRRIVHLKHDKLPDDIAEKLVDCKIQIIAWSEDEKAILQTVVQETGRNHDVLRIGRFREYLATIGVPTDSMSAAAKDLGLGKCPREGVRSLSKVLKRFSMLRKIVKRVFEINDLELIDGIFI